MAKNKKPIDEDNEVRQALLAKSRARRAALNGRAAVIQPGSRRNDLLPRLQLVVRRLDSLQSAPRRVRRKDAAQLARVRASIASFGVCVPILIDADGAIVNGHVVAEAARELGLTEAPCLLVEHLTHPEIRTLRIALNRLSETGSWDFDALKLEFRELIELGAPIEVAGFTLPEIDIILTPDEVEGREEGELQPDADLSQIARPGDLWRLGPHLLACGDARDPSVYASLFDDGEAAQLVLTDVPFNVPIAGHVTGGRHREFAMASGEMSRE